MRVSSWFWPFTFGVRLGWLTAGCANPDPAQTRDRVFFFRGNAVVFSRGFGKMCGLLRRAGYWAEDLRCIGHRWACRELTRRDEGPPGRVVFVGHSCGARYAIHAAEHLAHAGIAVDLLVCLEVALPPPVPANVTAAANLYLTRRRLYPAGPLRPGPGCTARIDNVDLDAPGSPVRRGWLNHLNITDSPAVQDWVLRRVFAALR
jgi:hypothetical protein